MHCRRLLIFGLKLSDSVDDVRRVIGAQPSTVVALREVPGADDAAFAVIDLGGDTVRGLSLVARVASQRRHGHALQPWLTTVAWV